TSGVCLGPYEVLLQIGVGGMGEVRVARFKREAQVLAALNHPNIAAIYGFEESNGIQALVLELAEGQTLADRLRRSEHRPLAKPIAGSGSALPNSSADSGR